MSCEVPIELRETAAIARLGEALRLGVPLPRGQVRAGAVARLRDAAGDAGCVQWRALSLWSDGSVRWALADFAVDLEAGARRELLLSFAGDVDGMATAPPGLAAPPAPRAAVSVVAQAGGFRVDTGVATFDVPGADAVDGTVLLSAATRDGRALLGATGLRWRLRAGAGGGAVAAARIDSIEVEERGPVRATLAVSGHATGPGLPAPLPFRARLAFSAGCAEACVEFRLRNPRAAVHPGGLWDLGDPGSVLLRDLSLCVAPAAPAVALAWCAAPGESRIEQPAGEWRLHQDSSGGERWDSPNHLAADGSLAVSFAGYRVTEGADAARA